MPAPIATPAAKEIPYDYVARFTPVQGKTRQSRAKRLVINISCRGAVLWAVADWL